jgi:mono/diheme cytochrome c family protein
MRYLFLLPLYFFYSCSSSGKPEDPGVASGKRLFLQNCASCHHVQQQLVGPPLNGVAGKWKMKDLYDYIHDPARYIDTRNDTRIIDLHRQYKLIMPAFPQLSEKDIDDIVSYIKEEEQNPVR